MNTKHIMAIIAIIIIALVVLGPLAVHAVGWVLGAFTYLAIAGAAGYGGYRLGQSSERRQLTR